MHTDPWGPARSSPRIQRHQVDPAGTRCTSSFPSGSRWIRVSEPVVPGPRGVTSVPPPRGVSAAALTDPATRSAPVPGPRSLAVSLQCCPLTSWALPFAERPGLRSSLASWMPSGRSPNLRGSASSVCNQVSAEGSPQGPLGLRGTGYRRVRGSVTGVGRSAPCHCPRSPGPRRCSLPQVTSCSRHLLLSMECKAQEDRPFPLFTMYSGCSISTRLERHFCGSARICQKRNDTTMVAEGDSRAQERGKGLGGTSPADQGRVLGSVGRSRRGPERGAANTWGLPRSFSLTSR